MGEGTRVVDYGKDIADLKDFVLALQQQVFSLKQTVANLQKRLEENGTLYGGAVAYSNTSIDGFQTKHNY